MHDRRFVRGAFLAFFVVILFSATEVFAATELPYEPFIPKAGDAEVRPASELVSCFDYYRFGSTPVMIASDLKNVSQGATIAFEGSLKNENAYPLTDVAVYAKVFHKRNPGVKDSFGPDIADWFLVEDNISLGAGESHPLTTSWNVPRDAVPGEYQIVTFVLSHDRFNMSGLSFTNDIIGGNYAFKVLGTGSGNTHFDVTATRVGDQTLRAAAYAPRMTFTDGAVPIAVHLTNPSSTRFDGKVVWKLYAWDTNLEANLLESREEAVTIGPNNSLTLPYSVSEEGHSVYNLIGELIPNDASQSKSFVAIRFVTDQAATPRINFVGVSEFPVVEGTTAFACIHSTGMSEAKDVRLELTATSNSILDIVLGKWTLAKRVYEGVAPGAQVALPTALSGASDSFTVRARLYQGGVLVDDVSVPYCTPLQSSCSTTNTIWYVLGGIVILLIIIGAVALMRKKQTPVV